MDPFDGAVAVVTGAASGIGRALALALAQRGATVHAADVNEQAVQDLALEHGALVPCRLDVSDEPAVAALLDRVVNEHGGIDYLFNNAGIVLGGEFGAANAAQWQRIVDVNLWGVVHGTRHGYRHMRRQGHGHIVNTASTAGVMPVKHSAAYATTKHAVVGLSTALRAEAAEHGIGVSVVIPGLVDTGIFDNATNVAGYDYRKTVDRMPLRKMTPERAAEHILAGVHRNRTYITFPLYNRAIIAAHRMLPATVGRLIARHT